MDPRVGNLVEKMKNRRVTSTLLVALTLAVGILIGSVISIGVKGKEGQKAVETATPLSVPAPQQLSSTFATIAKQIEPSVVNINTESVIKPQRRRRGVPQGHPGAGRAIRTILSRISLTAFSAATRDKRPRAPASVHSDPAS